MTDSNDTSTKLDPSEAVDYIANELKACADPDRDVTAVVLILDNDIEYMAAYSLGIPNDVVREVLADVLEQMQPDNIRPISSRTLN